MTTPITDLLAQIEAPGTFATRLRAPATDLDIEVKGVGPLKFPITARSAQKLRNVARPSPFGIREQTLHDPRVRNTWEVAASRVKVGARQWKPVLATYLRTLQTDLGFPDECEDEAVFDKLLIYEKGQFFKPHQDSEKDDEMVGTLVVILPSEYEGGAVTVEHRGEKKVFRRVESQARELSLLAFYADCHHAVSPIKSGVRVALTYQLRLAKHAKVGLPQVRADVVEHLAAAVREYFATPISSHYARSEPAPPERFVYLLDHEYTQRSLSWSHPKNGDRARVAALRATAEQLDCECFLSLAESRRCHLETVGRHRLKGEDLLALLVQKDDAIPASLNVMSKMERVDDRFRIHVVVGASDASGYPAANLERSARGRAIKHRRAAAPR